MVPHDPFHAQVYALALAIAAVITNKDTPELMRRELRSLIKKLRRRLPEDARREIEAAEAAATINTASYFRLEEDS